MLSTLLQFYAQYPSNILALRGVRRAELGAPLLEELDCHGTVQHQLLRAAQVYVLDKPAQLMLQDLSTGMKREGLDEMFGGVRLPFPSMLLTVPEPATGIWPAGLITQQDDTLYTQVFHESRGGFMPNLLIFASQGTKVEALYTPTFKLSTAIGEEIDEEAVIAQERPLSLSFLQIVVGMSVLLRYKAMLETEEVPAFPRAERRRAQKAGRPLPDMRVVKVRLGELGRGQLQAMRADEDDGPSDAAPRRAHWVQGHFMRNRAGGISWRNPHVRGAGAVVPQERRVSVADDASALPSDGPDSA